MKTVTDANLTAAKPAAFAKNVLQIATPPGNPKKIATFADLAKPDLKVVVCAPQVPCRAATQKIEKATSITLKPVSEEADVKSVLSKVETGSALAERAGGTMEDIVSSIRRVTDIMGEIAAASNEQSSGIEQVNKAVTLMDEATQQNAALVEQAAAAAESLEEQAQALNAAIAAFRLA